MKTYRWQLGLVSVLAVGGAIASGNCAFAQSSNIVPDGTLGAESSVVVPNYLGLPIEAIDGGAERGHNLFHSFQEFNVSEGRGAYFFSPTADIQNILARVTGSNRSEILGTLGTFGNSNPNLFLINPNGIIFGQNASLDVGGSFVATTANTIQFGNQGFFSASAPNIPPVLTVNPSAFLFNQITNASIQNNSIAPAGSSFSGDVFGLRVPDGQSLLLVGGDVSLSDGGRLNALGGRVELGGLVGVGTIELGIDDNIFSLNFTPDTLLSNVSLANDARVSVQGSGGGDIVVNTNTFTATDGGRLVAGTDGLGNGGDVTVKSNNFNISGVGTRNGSGIFNQTLASASGSAGNIFVNTKFLNATSGARVASFTSGQGDAGNVTITASDTVSFDGVGSNGSNTFNSGAFSTVEVGAVGNAGDINITAGSLFLTNGALLNTSTLGQGNAGNMIITVNNTISFDGVGSNGFSSGAFSNVEATGIGSGGDLNIMAGSLFLTKGGVLGASTFGQGDAGNLTITAKDIFFDGVGSNGFSSGAFSTVEATSVGNGGDINIMAGSLNLTNGAQLGTGTLGQGDAGNLTITAKDIFFDGVGSNGFSSGASSNVEATGVGTGGDLNIMAGSLFLTKGGVLGASTFGQGDAGNLTITAKDIFFDGIGSNGFSSGAFSTVEATGVGTGGDLNITTGTLALTNGAQVNASTFGQGNAGNLTINASDTISLDGVGSNGPSSARSNVQPSAVGDGGNINITTGSLFLTNEGALAAVTFGQGDAGSITIQAHDTVSVSGINSGVITSVALSGMGNGGDINIMADSLFLTNSAQVATTTIGQGNAGNIQVNASDSIFVGSGSLLRADTFGQGDAGNVFLQAGGTVFLDGVGANGVSSGVFTLVGTALGFVGEGEGGNISVIADSLSLTNGANLVTLAFGQAEEAEGRVNAGNITVNVTDDISVSGGAQLQSDTFGKGDAGDITLQAGGAVIFDGLSSASSAVNFNGDGKAGDITITAGSLSLRDSAQLRTAIEPGAVGQGGDINITADSLTLTSGGSLGASTFGQGDAGNVTITASNISFDGVGSNNFSSGAFSTVEATAIGAGGDINITTESLSVTNGAVINASTFGQGDAGNVTITANERIFLDRVGSNGFASGIFSTVAATSVGSGGDINITTGMMSLEQGAQVATNTTGQARETKRADAGNIEVNVADSLTVSGGSVLRSDTFGQGDAGNVTIASENAAVSFDGVEVINGAPNPTSSGVFSFVGSNPLSGLVGNGKGGNITITARSLSLTNGAQLRSDTFGVGTAGNVFIAASDTVLLDGFSIENNFYVPSGIASTIGRDVQVGAVGNGTGGNISVKARSLSLTNGGALDVSTQGQGNAGNIFVKVADAVSLSNFSSINSTVGTGGVGNGGDIDIKARSLSLTNGSQVGAVVFRQQGNTSGGQGQGGNIRITTDAINISGISSFTLPASVVNLFNPSEPLQTEGFSSGLFTSTERGATGKAGSITVNTGTFRLADGAVVDALTANSGNAGDITINANSFEVTGGGQVITTTRSNGRAGNIRLNVIDSINISGSDPTFATRFAQFGEDIVNNQGAESGLFANTAPGSTGDGGSILIDPIQLTIADGAGISVDSQGQGNAGNLQIQAGSITLDNRGFLSATTASGEGGNLTLQVEELLLLRRHSNISTEAGGSGNGGNIDIAADFIVAFLSEDSNIIADAIEGRGGKIDITTQAILGIQRPEEQTPFSDITASSQLGVDGTVEINTPDVDLQNALTELSANFASPDQVVAGSCLARRNVERGSFTVTGTGGLPSSPYEAVSGRYAVTSVQPIRGNGNVSNGAASVENTTTWKPGDPIQEAQGIVATADGRLILGTTPQLVAVANTQELVCQPN